MISMELAEYSRINQKSHASFAPGFIPGSTHAPCSPDCRDPSSPRPATTPQAQEDVMSPTIEGHRTLSQHQRDEILQRVDCGEKKSDLAKEFGVSRAAVTKLCKREKRARDGLTAAAAASHVHHETSQEEQESRSSSFPMIPVEIALSKVLEQATSMPSIDVPLQEVGIFFIRLPGLMLIQY